MRSSQSGKQPREGKQDRDEVGKEGAAVQEHNMLDREEPVWWGRAQDPAGHFQRLNSIWGYQSPLRGLKGGALVFKP
jgi:hypothetical protein